MGFKLYSRKSKKLKTPIFRQYKVPLLDRDEILIFRKKFASNQSPDSSPKLSSNGARLSLVELTVLTKEIGKSIDRNLEKSPEGITSGSTREEKERKFSQELDEIIENCHAHLDGMIDQMELSANRDSERSENLSEGLEDSEGLQGAEGGPEDEDKVSSRE